MDDTTVIGSSPPKPAKKEFKKIEIHAKNPSHLSCVTKDHGQKHASKKTSSSIEDRKLVTEKRILCDELTKQVSFHRKEIEQLKQATKILRSYEEEKNILNLISKWRDISQAGMSFIMNSTLIKISRIGGYEELLRKEFEAEKRKIEYQVDDTLQDQLDEVLESEEFQMQSEELQQEYKERAEEKLKEAETWKEAQFSKLEDQMKNTAGRELTMEELSKRLKVEYDLVFPE